MAVRVITIDYRPRKAFQPLHRRKTRWAVVVAHRRAGKTVACVNELIKAAVTFGGADGRFAYVAPFYKQAKSVAWDYLKRFVQPIPHIEINESELRVDFPNGARVQLFGADKADSLRGLYFDGLVADEYGDWKPSVWQYVIRPALADRQGWAIIIGTPKGRNEFYQRVKHAEADADWLLMIVRAADSGILQASEMAAMQKEMSEDAWRQEMECDFDAALLGAIYGKEMWAADQQGRIREVGYDKAVPVHTAWDLGYSDDTAIWWYQVIRGEIHVLEYYGASGLAMDDYVAVIKSKPYQYGIHWLPHDARAETLASGGKSIQEMAWRAFGHSHVRIVPGLSVQDGIQSARAMLPHCWFDAVGCEQGIESLKQYQREWDEDKKAFREKPRHDWCFTGDTMILTRYGMHQIIELPNTGEVLTSCGWKRYKNPRVTRRNAQLVEVVFVGGYTVRCTPDHMFKTVSGWKSAEFLTKGMQIQSTLTLSRSILMAVYTAYGRAITTIHAAAKSCIVMLGLRRLGQFLTGATYTTGMAIQPITPYQISNASTLKSICRSVGKCMGLNVLSISQRMPVAKPLNGMDPRLEGCGTAVTQNASKTGRNGSAKTCLASIAARSLAALLGRVATLRSIVQTSARWPLIGRVVPAQKPVRVIESVKKLSNTGDVWCLTVPDAEEFSLSNGAVVHNCSHAADGFRMLAVAWKTEQTSVEPEKPKFPLDRTFDELVAAQRRKREQ